MVVVEQKITALEQAIAGLQEYVPVTEVTLNVTEANLKVGETVQLTAIVAPDNASQEVPSGHLMQRVSLLLIVQLD